MRQAFIGALLGAIVFAAPAVAQDKMSAEKFVEKAAQSNIAEAQLGKLAAEKAQSDQVKRFAQRMVDDHTKANTQLVEATQGKFTLPKDVATEHGDKMRKMQGMQGEDFDRAYMREMLTEHRNDVKMFQDYARNGDDQALKTFAQNTLPVLQEHLKMAQDITGGEKAETPSTTPGGPSGTTR